MRKSVVRRGIAGGVLLAALTAGTTWSPAPAAAGQLATCGGDCDHDTLVSVAELVRVVDIALRRSPLSDCDSVDVNGDGQVTVDEVVAAVAESLDGCPGQTARPTKTETPTGSPTATPTDMPLATTTPTSPPTPPQTICGNGTAEGLEECDDGNTTSGDGCDETCRLEPGGNPCAGVPTSTGTGLRAELLAGGLSSPLYVTAPPLDPHRVFIVERPGVIRIVKDGILLPAAFLDISDRVKTAPRFPEQGLLGLAFHPDYEHNGIFFVDYTNLTGRGNTSISRFQVGANPDDADEASEVVLFTVTQPAENHNGGQLAFGADGFLYIGMGDGGGAGDPLESGQSYRTLLGKILRVDVNVDAPPHYGVPPTNPNAGDVDPFGLIWSIGLRNPWRFSFDRLTQDLYIADVGQAAWEEIDFQPAASTGNENYGWDIFEGAHCFEPQPLFPQCPDPPTGYTMPVLEYDHGSQGGCSVTGGFVYRGCSLPDLRGTYFYADYCKAFIRSFRLVDGVVTAEHDWTNEIQPAEGAPITAISSFGEDVRGELYVCDLTKGNVFKLVPSTEP